MNSNTFESTVAGIPCLIEIVHFDYQPPSRKSPLQCETPDEYYGHLEIEFLVRDRKGYLAGWLEAKLTDKDIDRINGEALSNWKSRDDY
jgi:hypothetical protein